MVKPKLNLGQTIAGESVDKRERFWWLDGVVIAFLIVLAAVQLKSFWATPDKSNVFSAPMIPMLAGLFSWLLGVETPVVITNLLLVILTLAAPFLYLFTLYLARRRLTAVSAALIYLLPLDAFARSRYKMAFLVGDGGHLASLVFVPLVALPLLAFLRTGRFSRLILASLSMALIALTTLFGSLAGLMTLGVIAFSELLQGNGRIKIVRFGLFVLLTVGLAAFWYNPSFVMSYFNTDRGQSIWSTLVNLIPISFVVVPVAGAFGFLLFEKKKQLQPLFIALGLTVMYTTIFFADYSSTLFPSHPRRYLPELGLALALLGGIVTTALADYLKLKGKFFKYKLTPAGRKLAFRVWLGLIFGGAGILTVTMIGSLWQLPYAQVLGLQTGEVALTSVWEARERTGWLAAWVGHGISLLTVFIISLVWLQIKRVVGEERSAPVPQG